VEGLVNGPVSACQCEIAATGGARETIDPIDVGKIPGASGKDPDARRTPRRPRQSRARDWDVADVGRLPGSPAIAHIEMRR